MSFHPARLRTRFPFWESHFTSYLIRKLSLTFFRASSTFRSGLLPSQINKCRSSNGRGRPMAKRQDTRSLAPSLSKLEFSLPSAPKFLFSLVLFLAALSSAFAQTSQQYVYLSAPGSPSSSLAGLSKTSQTGSLSLVPNSPFNERLEGGLLAIDGQGKFLFVLNPLSNDISMFQINQTSGALSEVSGSPFAVPPTINPNMAPSQPI